MGDWALWALLHSLWAAAAMAHSDASVFPLHGAVFLPPDSAPRQPPSTERYLATMETIRPILDVGIVDAWNHYLRGWAPPDWLHIHESPIRECDDQKTAAWSALAAHRWTNGSGLDVTFGPACDYVLASIARILSFYDVPMFTNAGFSEYFNSKEDFPLTRVGPLQDHITQLIDRLASKFEWRRPQLLYQKSFWESELREAGFCKLLMTGMYVWTVEKKWNLTVNPRIVPSFYEAEENPREFFRNFLVDSIGSNYGGYAFVYALAPVARMSPYWADADSRGIPVITSIGLTSNLDNREEYSLMTRISSPYKVVRNSILQFFGKFGWKRTFYLFHDSRHHNDPTLPYSECYLLMTSIHLELSNLFHSVHNYFMFNEDALSKKELREKLKHSSFISNGKFLCLFEWTEPFFFSNKKFL